VIKAGGSPTAKISRPFSVRSEEKRQEARGKKRRKQKRGRKRGRRTTAEKVALAERTERVFPKGVPETGCWLSHTRPVWRLEQGTAVLVAYGSIAARTTSTGEFPGYWTGASSGWKSFSPSRTRSTFSDCRSTRYVC
jgi:transposase